MTNKESLLDQRFDGELDDYELLKQLRMTFDGTGDKCEQVLHHIRSNDLQQQYESVNRLVDDIEESTEKAFNVTDDNQDLIDVMDEMIVMVEDGEPEQILPILDDIVIPLANEIRDELEELRPEMPPYHKYSTENIETLHNVFDNLVEEFTVIIVLAEEARDRFQE